MENKRNMKKTLLIVLAVIVALILLVLGGIALYVDYLIGLLVGGNTGLENQESSTFETIDVLPMEPEDTLPSNHTFPTVNSTLASSGPADIIEVDDVVNVMLLGQDASNGLWRTRTDTMILCTINTKDRSVSLTSFQRDLYVYIPGWDGYHKLNSAYPFGGYEMFKDTMEYNFGLQIDFIVHVKLEMFAQVVDILGGVDIDLTQAEADYINNSGRKENWAVHAGRNHLNGAQTLCYSRIRYIDSDFFRTERQRKVLTSIFDTYKQKPIPELLEVTEQILPLILTYDLEKADVYKYIFTLAPMLSGCSMESYQIPWPGTWQSASADGMYIIDADLDANRNYLAQIINP